MLNLAKKFWKELNKARYIEISYGTEEDVKRTHELDFTVDAESKKLNKALKERIRAIKLSKLQKIIQTLVIFHVDNELANTGLLLTRKESLKRAEADLKDAIIAEKLDYFYNFVN